MRVGCGIKLQPTFSLTNGGKATMSQTLSLCCILAAGVFWGISPLFIRQFSAAGFSPEQMVFTRFFFASLFLAGWLAAKKPMALRFRLVDIWCFAGTGIVSTMLFSYCYFRTMETANIALAALLLYTSPIFVLFFSVLLFRERMTRRKLLAVACTFAGCAAITGILTHGVPVVAWPVILIGLGAGLFYSLYTIFGKYALRRYASVTVAVHTFIFATIGTAFLIPIPETFALYANPANLLTGLGIALFCSLTPFVLYTKGLEKLSPAKAAVLATIEPVVATLIGIAAFHEPADAATFAGVALIIGATVLLSGEDAS